MRALLPLAGLIVCGVLAAPAQARLVYVKRAGTAAPVVYTATNSGEQPRRLGIGRAPTVSPNGRWVAYITIPRAGSEPEEVTLVPVAGGARRLLLRSRSLSELRFSPDSGRVAVVARGRRVRVYDIEADETVDPARGFIRGYSFSPDGTQLAFGVATGPSANAPSDIYVAPVDRSVERRRVTTTGDALNPVWGVREIVFDRQRRRRGDAPAYNLWATDASGTAAPRRVTAPLNIPPLASGLVPLELSRDGRRLLAVFTGESFSVGFTVNPRSGRTRALSREGQAVFVGFDLSGNGRVVLGQTGGIDPAGEHDVVRVPYTGGEPEVLVEDAAFPDWSR